MSADDQLTAIDRRSSTLRVLLTRAAHKNQPLISTLHSYGIFAYSHPMLTLESSLSEKDLVNSTILQSDLVIAVSEPAVEFFKQALLACSDVDFIQQVQTHLSQIPLLAVGNTTACAFEEWLNVAVNYPQLATSEGLLQEPIANKVLHQPCIEGKQVVILRGNGGRELIASELNSRGANVCYLQSYQRRSCVDVNNIWLDQWKSQQINCIVTTSIKQFSALWNLAQNAQQKAWLQGCLWVVASDRIKQTLLVHGIDNTNIFNAHGANNDAVFKQLLSLAKRTH